MSYIIITIFSILLLPGIICTLIPVVPALPYMFLVALIYGFIDKFAHLSPYEIIILAVVTIISIVVDWVSGILGAKYGGASVKSIYAGLAGFIIGMILLPPFGGLLGLFVAIFLSEVMMMKNHLHALKSAAGGLIGSIIGIVINFIISIIFLATFIVLALK